MTKLFILTFFTILTTNSATFAQCGQQPCSGQQQTAQQPKTQPVSVFGFNEEILSMPVGERRIGVCYLDEPPTGSSLTLNETYINVLYQNGSVVKVPIPGLMAVTRPSDPIREFYNPKNLVVHKAVIGGVEMESYSYITPKPIKCIVEMTPAGLRMWISF